MEVSINPGTEVFFKQSIQQNWQGNDILQTTFFAGKEMIAITNDDSAFELMYLDFVSGKFSTMEQAKEAAPAFAIVVLSRMISLVERI